MNDVETMSLVHRIAPLFLPYIGQGQVICGRRTAKLLCSVTKCYREDEIDAGWLEFPSESYDKKIRAVAEKFVKRGWGYDQGPICPDCRKGRRPQSK